jgi:hypothetical protein
MMKGNIASAGWQAAQNAGMQQGRHLVDLGGSFGGGSSGGGSGSVGSNDQSGGLVNGGLNYQNYSLKK